MDFRRFLKKTSITEVTPEEARAKQQAGAVIVDVREPYEWSEGIIPGAVLLSLGELSGRLQELDPSREIITVCRSGHRSMSAAQILQRAGFTQVGSLSGGMIGWNQRHLPVTKSSGM